MLYSKLFIIDLKNKLQHRYIYEAEGTSIDFLLGDGRNADKGFKSSKKGYQYFCEIKSWEYPHCWNICFAKNVLKILG